MAYNEVPYKFSCLHTLLYFTKCTICWNKKVTTHAQRSE